MENRESKIDNHESGTGNQEIRMPKWEFRVADLTEADWGPEGPFDMVLAFAVLHHLPPVFYPGILQKVHRFLTPLPPRSPSPFPLFIFSNWQFLNSPRWRARIQPWERVGLTTNDVGPNDYLLDWRRGGEGLRYVHHFSEEELGQLAEAAGFEILETFYSDGKEGNLGMYQLWRPE
jgi:hypothetical protein